MKNLKIRIYSKLIIVEIAVISIMRFLLPVLANYPPFSETASFQLKIETLTHDVQYLLLGVTAITLHLIFINMFFKHIFNYLKKDVNKITLKETNKIREECYNIPKKLMIIQLILLSLTLIILFAMVEMSVMLFIKFLLIYFSFFITVWVISIVLIKKDLNKIIDLTYQRYSDYQMPTNNTNFYKTLIYNLIPLFIAVIVNVTLFGYASTTDRMGEGLYYYYQQSLKDVELDNLNLGEIRYKLSQIELKDNTHYYFIINDEIKFISNTNGNISKFFIEYAKDFLEDTNGRVYEYYGIEEEAYAKKVKLQNGEEVYVGFKYATTNSEIAMPFITVAILYTILYLVILIIWSRNISKNISNVSEQLMNIANNAEAEQDIVLPIYSGDEIGKLSNAYNKIQNLTNEQIRKLKEDEEKIKEQTELNTLGELAGEIAHDLSSPLVAVRTNISTFYKYINSERIQTDIETKEKLEKMIVNMEKSLEGMSQTISTVKKQIQNSGDTEKKEISLLDLLEQIKILNSSKFRNCNCQLINNINYDIKIFGERNKLDRIITNILNNSLDAYKFNKIKGNIVLDLNKDDKYYIISISDNAGGIPKEIQEKLLKEQITTKGKDGTGIGLKNPNNLLVTAFDGKMTFESKDNIGTTFYIKIPKNIVMEEQKNG